MKKRTDRLAIVSEINSAAKLYRDNLVGKSFMYVFDSRFIEVAYRAENFKHLTGVDSRLSAKNFYQLAKSGKLAASQICFSNRHPFNLCKKKIRHISQLAELTNSECFMLEEISTQSQTFKFGSTNLKYSILLNQRNGSYIAESLRDEDCFPKSRNVYSVTHIFSRQNDEKEYRNIIYDDNSYKNAGLPKNAMGLLASSLLKSLSSTSQTDIY